MAVIEKRINYENTEETLNSGSRNKWNKSEVKVEKVG